MSRVTRQELLDQFESFANPAPNLDVLEIKLAIGAMQFQSVRDFLWSIAPAGAEIIANAHLRRLVCNAMGGVRQWTPPPEKLANEDATPDTIKCLESFSRHIQEDWALYAAKTIVKEHAAEILAETMI